MYILVVIFLLLISALGEAHHFSSVEIETETEIEI